jgi:NAD(P)-dependent dehydrogenase (short-subunit alcohol dehydrogenase family)
MPEWVLVAGAASGIGKATAIELCEAGYNLVLVDINKAGLEKLQSLIPDSMIFEADLSDEKVVLGLSEFLSEQKILLSGVICTIGKAITMPVKSLHVRMYEDLFSLNVFSFHLLVRDLVKAEIFNPDGASVVTISSITADVGAKGKTAYGASKGSLNNLVRSMSLELSNKNIRINAISPGTILSEMLERLENNIGKENVEILKNSYPLGFGYPEDVASIAVYLISRTSKWMTGTVLTVDGGYSTV